MIHSPFEMKFDPRTINHLGVRMYSTLPPAVAEIVSNAYDADAEHVVVTLQELDGKPFSIVVADDGEGLSREEINEKFLVIGRNRREDDDDAVSAKFKRKRTGKKGLGKLALFGLASTIEVRTRKGGLRNTLVLDWGDLNSARGSYRPRAEEVDVPTNEADGTTVTLSGLKRKSAFDPEALADSLSRLFVPRGDFNVTVETTAGDRIAVDSKRRYRTFDTEFAWSLSNPQLVPESSSYHHKVVGDLMTAATPIAPSSGLRGISLFSRGKLVNAPEFFSASTSSHFYQYLTGWISVDFIDEFQEDVISTNRQSLDWEHPEMGKLREFLAGVVATVNADWRRLRKEKKDTDLQNKTGIDTKAWLATLPPDTRASTSQILESLGGEDALEKFTPIVKALHSLIPEYPLLHWRHLHEKVRDRVQVYYRNEQYGLAASEGAKIYCDILRELTGSGLDSVQLVNSMFGSAPNYSPPPKVQLNSLATESLKNIQEGQAHLSRGLMTGFRNPIAHAPVDTMVPSVFTELDCLNVLSLVSYLVTRLDVATIN